MQIDQFNTAVRTASCRPVSCSETLDVEMLEKLELSSAQQMLADAIQKT
ncbi:MAG: hypothetical protein AB2L14_24260 [Candidatus Xenobiia bacterium LiM19]